MRYFLSVTMFLFFCLANGQQKTYNHQLSFTTDNDAYLLQKKDGYYTNGLFLKLSVASKKKEHKIVTSYELGQMIFTPGSVFFYIDGGIDRPFCGYLYASYNKAIFLPNQQLVQWAVSIGTVGQNSLGQNVQQTIHKWFNFKTFKSWDTQIDNEIGVNTSAKYAKAFLPLNTPLLKIIPEAEATLGTSFTNAKVGGFLCFGLMENIDNTNLFNAGIGRADGSKKTPTELFIYWHPQLVYQAYNATVQGGLFFKSANDITAPICSTIYTQTFGLLFAANRFTTKLEIVYLTQEAITQKLPQRYASIGVGYRFH